MRSFSDLARRSLIEQTTSEVWLALLEIRIGLDFFYVVANSSVPVVSQGITYTPYPFDIVLPADTLESVETVQITIDNVDLMLVSSLRAAQEPLVFALRFVLASQPDVIELELNELESDRVEWNATTISATLAVTDIWNAKFPSIGGIYDPAQCPELF